MQVLKNPPSGWPALVLNADFRPLSYYPLSLWPWQEVIKAVFLDRVDVISSYDHIVRSPSFEMRLPSVVALKSYVAQDRAPAFTRFNLFLRDAFTCQYCGSPDDLTFDHIVPRSKGGVTTWTNVVTCCQADNLFKGSRSLKQSGLRLRGFPTEPTPHQIDEAAKWHLSRENLHKTWLDFFYWDADLEA